VVLSMFSLLFSSRTHTRCCFSDREMWERERGREVSAEVGVQCQRCSWSTVASGKWTRSPSLTADEHGLTEYFQTSEKAVGTALKVPSERWVEKISHGTWKRRLEIDYGRYEPFLTWTLPLLYEKP